MGATGSLNERVGVNSSGISEMYEVPNDKPYHAEWANLTWTEGWDRKHIEGEEAYTRGEDMQEFVHSERRTDCIVRAKAYLRSVLFEPRKNANIGDTIPCEAYFSTDDITKCWFPWAKPRRLYTLDAEFVDSILNLAGEYGQDKDTVQIWTGKQHNKGHFHMRLLEPEEVGQLKKEGGALGKESYYEKYPLLDCGTGHTTRAGMTNGIHGGFHRARDEEILNRNGRSRLGDWALPGEREWELPSAAGAWGV